jgi:hypothetical protein
MVKMQSIFVILPSDYFLTEYYSFGELEYIIPSILERQYANEMAQNIPYEEELGNLAMYSDVEIDLVAKRYDEVARSISDLVKRHCLEDELKRIFETHYLSFVEIQKNTDIYLKFNKLF